VLRINVQFHTIIYISDNMDDCFLKYVAFTPNNNVTLGIYSSWYI